MRLNAVIDCLPSIVVESARGSGKVASPSSEDAATLSHHQASLDNSLPRYCLLTSRPHVLTIAVLRSTTPGVPAALLPGLGLHTGDDDYRQKGTTHFPGGP